MKRHHFYYCLWAMLIGWQVVADAPKTNDWGSMTNNVQMSISLKGESKELKVNQEFSLLVRIKNLSTNETINLRDATGADTDPWQGLSCAVVSPSGKDVSPNRPNTASSGRVINVRPGETGEFEFNLGSLCKLEEVGTYTIIAKKNFSISVKRKSQVVSNPLDVSVVADP